ncbi:MAG: hypothetical protein IPG79_07750 [Saprospiraceae bacterium]|nr:hypothetical protein [Saprospiraceae bacterium]MBK7524660.1 hypothetical protein [Saprospiraceae bacterium]MBP6694153.1 hypothetical protein [Saprospiraceae bacterium]
MTKFKVVCNRGDYAYTFDKKEDASTAAENHTRRTRHNPVYIYELKDEVEMTRDELLAVKTPDEQTGIIQITVV